MIIALISDVHGNLPALNAVLKDAKNAKAKQIWCLGDSVGYIPFPNECVKLIRKKADASVIGNYDQKVICFRKKKADWKKSKNSAKFEAFAWNNQQLSTENKKYLRSLPQTIRLGIGKFKIFMTHGSPQHINEPVPPETSKKKLSELGKIADADIILTGHTHRFMNRKAGNRWFINPGSVGLPVKTDLTASYALLEISEDKINVTQRKIEYDISKVIKGLQGTGFAEHLKQMIGIEYGISLNRKTKQPSTVNTAKPESRHILKTVMRFAEECDYEKQHSHQVTKLALNLFDELKPLHKLKNKHRFLLHCAGLLHDIGWIEGQQAHHKTSMKLILDAQRLPFTNYQRKIIALIARYHRRSLPKNSHPVFSQLSDKDKRRTKILAGMLRTADGLDRTHTCAVKSVKCDFSGKDLFIRCKAAGPAIPEIEAAYAKSDLLQQALHKNIHIEIPGINTILTQS